MSDTNDIAFDRSFTVEYTDFTVDEGLYDVSVDLTESAEELLFQSLAYRLADSIHDHRFDPETVHIYKQLGEQRRQHLPWEHTDDDVRTYDLVLTASNYQTLSEIVGDGIGDAIGPEAADAQMDLVTAWRSITEQMRAQDGDDVVTIEDGSRFRVLTDERTGDEWYQCLDCNMSYVEIGDEHDCLLSPDTVSHD